MILFVFIIDYLYATILIQISEKNFTLTLRRVIFIKYSH